MSETTTTIRKICIACRFEAPADGPWERIEDVTFGTLLRCPRCESTDVQHVR